MQTHAERAEEYRPKSIPIATYQKYHKITVIRCMIQTRGKYVFSRYVPAFPKSSCTSDPKFTAIKSG